MAIVQWECRFNPRLQGIVDIDHHQSCVGDYIHIVATNGHMAGPLQGTIAIPGQRPLQEIIAGFAIHQRIDVRENQALFGVENVGIIVERMERLLEIYLAHQVSLVAGGLYGLRGRQDHTGRIWRIDAGVVAKWAERRGDQTLRDSLVRNAGNIVGLHALASLGDKKVLTAVLEATHRAGTVWITVLQFPVR